MTKRGTSRRAIGIKKPVHDRLKAHVDQHPDVSCSSYVEETLRMKHPEVFGEEAPPPPELTEEEKAAQEKRRQEARSRVDQDRFDQIVSEGPTAPEPKTRPEEKPGRRAPTPAPAAEDDRLHDEEFPPSIILF